jgi:transmembrane sensor
MSTDRLHFLLDSYAGGNCTAEQIQELHQLLQDDWTRIQLGQQVPAIDWERMYEEIMASTKEKPTPVVQLTKRWWFAAAAIIVLAASTVIVVSLTSNSRRKPVFAGHNEIPPGGNRAILTLGNGEQIVLDSAHKGLLTQQGNTRVIQTDSGTLAYTMLNGKQTDVVYNMLTCPRGGQYKVQLPDGTDVWLNSSSSIRYPTAFPNQERKVEITGEAYFEVARDEARPFVVEVGNVETKVLGTHFNINSYVNEESVKTTLLEGKIVVALHSGRQVKSDEFLVLKPGQQAVALPLLPASFDKSDRKMQSLSLVNDVNVEQVVSWKNGLFSFNQADLTTVLRQLERWYNIDVRYTGNVPVRHFTGELSRDLTLSQVISVLSEMDVKFKIEGKTLTVME